MLYIRHTERNRKKFALRTVDHKKAHDVFSSCLACCTIRQSILQSETWPYPACGSKRPIKKLELLSHSVLTKTNGHLFSYSSILHLPIIWLQLQLLFVIEKHLIIWVLGWFLPLRLVYLWLIEWLLQPNLNFTSVYFCLLSLRSWRCFWCFFFLCSCKSLFT